MMEVQFPHSAGLDVHKKTVVAAVITGVDDKGNEVFDTKTFGTMTRSLLQLSDWLHSHGVTHVAMESTGEYWKPLYNILEDDFELLVVNAAHAKNVPGRKTDIKDAQWLTVLLTYGLLRASFIPSPGQRELREMTRARAGMVRERANLSNRLHRTLECANIKLSSVATDLQGVSAREMLAAVIEGKQTPSEMAQLARRKMRSKIPLLEEALDGRVKEHHRFILAELLGQIDGLDETIERFDAEIERMVGGNQTSGTDGTNEVYVVDGGSADAADAGRALLDASYARAVAHLDTIPGIGRSGAIQILAEIGTDMNRFPTAGHLAAWGGVAPGNHQSAGKTLSRRVRQGNHSLKRILTECANAAKRTGGYLAAQYHRLAGRIGKSRATIALAHSILVVAYHLIKRDEDYKELGGDYFDRRLPQRTVERLLQRLSNLGVDVTLHPRTDAEALPTPA